MARKATTWKAEWRFEHRLAYEHLGRAKYSSSVQAIGELVANALDAGALRVDIEVEVTELDAIASVSISDNGRGITPEDIHTRFVVIGVQPQGSTGPLPRYSRLGIGRLAVHRIGSLSHWKTVSATDDGRVELSFSISPDAFPGLQVTERVVGKDTPTGTAIKIYNIADAGPDRPTPPRITKGLRAQFFGRLLSDSRVNLRVQGEPIDATEFVLNSEEEAIQVGATPAKLKHIVLRKDAETHFPAPVLLSAKGRTIATAQPDSPLPPNYICMVECEYLDQLVTSNRESLIEMDGTVARLRELVLERVSAYAAKLASDSQARFIERMRDLDFYPYRSVTDDPVMLLERARYEGALKVIHEQVNVDRMPKKHKEMFVKLLQRALYNDNVIDVLNAVVKLSDTDMKKLRDVLERTTLESIVQLASEVTGRIAFLDVLHDLVYGDPAKHLRERTQLHLIVERHCWLFGPHFNLATSDQSFREVVKKHREAAKLTPLSDVDVNAIKGVQDIPDLFLVASKGFHDRPQRRHVIVELKAPSVKIGDDEIQEIRHYANVIMRSDKFDKSTTSWELFVVSSVVDPGIDWQRNQENFPVGCVSQGRNMKLWCFSWAELIERARVEMALAMDNLKSRSIELQTSTYLKKHHPDIFDALHAHPQKAGSPVAVAPAHASPAPAHASPAEEPQAG